MLQHFLPAIQTNMRGFFILRDYTIHLSKRIAFTLTILHIFFIRPTILSFLVILFITFFTTKIINMKMNIVVWLFCYALCATTACKKEMDNSVNTVNTNQLQSSSTDEFGFNPSLFREGINNPYFPLVPGTVFHWVNLINDDGGSSTENNIVTVTSNIKKILGVNCEVVHDFIKEGGELTEDTYDWYAQDKFGNVWYFGEDTKELTDTGWSTEGSWQAGVNGAKPGIIMPGNPDLFIGRTYYQEFQAELPKTRQHYLIQAAPLQLFTGILPTALKPKSLLNWSQRISNINFMLKALGRCWAGLKMKKMNLLVLCIN